MSTATVARIAASIMERIDRYARDYVDLPHPDAERDEIERLINELGNRDHVELRDKRSDLLDVRGLLSPRDRFEPPFPQCLPLGDRVAPAIEMLLNEYERIRDERTPPVDDDREQIVREARAFGLRAYADYTARLSAFARETDDALSEVLDLLIEEMRGIADRFADGTFPQGPEAMTVRRMQWMTNTADIVPTVAKELYGITDPDTMLTPAQVDEIGQAIPGHLDPSEVHAAPSDG